MNFDLILNNILEHGVQLDASQKTTFTSLLETRKIAKKEYLFNVGEICRYDYFVNKGCLKVCYYDDDGKECIIKFAVENYWVVDLDSFLNFRPSFYFVEAVENSDLFQLSRENYDILHREIPAFHAFSNKRWQAGFIALQHRIIQSHSLTAEERYLQFRQKYPGLEQRISQRMVASYLGITPQFLSAMKKSSYHKTLHVA